MTSHFFDLAVGESAYPSQGFPVTGSLVNGEAPIPKTYTVNASQNIALTLERPPRNVKNQQIIQLTFNVPFTMEFPRREMFIPRKYIATDSDMNSPPFLQYKYVGLEPQFEGFDRPLLETYTHTDGAIYPRGAMCHVTGSLGTDVPTAASQPPNVTHWVATLRKLTKKTFPKYRAILCRERPDMVITSKDDDMLK